ncbi:hypothetical protein HID58_011059 [Brassica napus]|uniref:Protein kinase domain-containing protein n=1 Tax=Brassica napus TaxID=3708 RepID=A0ABQ8DX17_BRANA|nr:hypothetical protein HID58_011059 [Brassica napus]
MNCFSCFHFHEKKKTPRDSENSRRRNGELTGRDNNKTHPENPDKAENEQNKNNDANKEVTNNIDAQTFTFRELATATKNFRKECLIGEGGFGRVYKGKLEKCDKAVAVKQLDRNGLQGNREFIVEVMMLSLLHHKHLVNLIGYCADGDQRLLVYEYMSRGSLEDHLLELTPDQEPFHELADPSLEGVFPEKALNQAVAVAAMCLQEEGTVRPLISDVVTALGFLGTAPDGSISVPRYDDIPSPPQPSGETSGDDSAAAEERERAVAEAMEWGVASRAHSRNPSAAQSLNPSAAPSLNPSASHSRNPSAS